MCLIRRFFVFLCAAVLLLSFPSARGEGEGPSGSVLRLHQIDVGSGDAYLLTVDDIVILVDCGINTLTPLGNGAKHPELNKYIASSGTTSTPTLSPIGTTTIVTMWTISWNCTERRTR